MFSRSFRTSRGGFFRLFKGESVPIPSHSCTDLFVQAYRFSRTPILIRSWFGLGLRSGRDKAVCGPEEQVEGGKTAPRNANESGTTGR